MSSAIIIIYNLVLLLRDRVISDVTSACLSIVEANERDLVQVLKSCEVVRTFNDLDCLRSLFWIYRSRKLCMSALKVKIQLYYPFDYIYAILFIIYIDIHLKSKLWNQILRCLYILKGSQLNFNTDIYRFDYQIKIYFNHKKNNH